MTQQKPQDMMRDILAKVKALAKEHDEMMAKQRQNMMAITQEVPSNVQAKVRSFVVQAEHDKMASRVVNQVFALDTKQAATLFVKHNADDLFKAFTGTIPHFFIEVMDDQGRTTFFDFKGEIR